MPGAVRRYVAYAPPVCCENIPVTTTPGRFVGVGVRVGVRVIEGVLVGVKLGVGVLHD